MAGGMSRRKVVGAVRATVSHGDEVVNLIGTKLVGRGSSSPCLA